MFPPIVATWMPGTTSPLQISESEHDDGKSGDDKGGDGVGAGGFDVFMGVRSEACRCLRGILCC